MLVALHPKGRLTTTLLLSKLERGGRQGGPLEMADPQPFERVGAEGWMGVEEWDGGWESFG